MESRQRRPLSGLCALVLACCSCGGPTAPSGTGLTGTVVRGPIQPVCRVDVPCDAPFAAGFSVKQGSRTVAAFRSDSQGHFEVRLAPATYVVVPDSDAPVMAPMTQEKEVVVGSEGLTTVVLHFDTGIR
jgi:hypothetical protein